jgi:hypothetical protein
MAAPQSFKNHTRFDPLFHYFILPVLLLNIPASIYWYAHHYHQFSHSGLWVILLTVVLLVLAGMARGYALKVQDRVIRLEEKLRLAALVSPTELIELDSLTLRQYVALRFASNPELPELARRAIRENLSNKQIKQSIKSWRADNDRVESVEERG